MQSCFQGYLFVLGYFSNINWLSHTRYYTTFPMTLSEIALGGEVRVMLFRANRLAGLLAGGCLISPSVSPPTGIHSPTAVRTKPVCLWNTYTGQKLSTLRGHTDRVWSVSFSPDGHMVASGSYDQTVRLWGRLTQGSVFTLPGHMDWVISVTFCPTGTTPANRSWDQTVRWWDVVPDRLFHLIDRTGGVPTALLLHWSSPG